MKDPLVQAAWREFAAFDRRFWQEVISPIQNKVGQLIMAPPVRNILGQVRSCFDARFMMDNQRIFIENLAKGRLGEDKARLLGSVLVTQFQLAAMSRASTAESGRADFFLYIDEFHNFSTEAFVTALSEARKYRLCLSLSHQYTAQLSDGIRDAVFGNVGTIIAFRVGHTDAHLLSHEFAGEFAPEHFVELPNHRICVKLLADGDYGNAFAGQTLPPAGRCYGQRENVIRRSRERYAARRAEIERRIERWLSH